MRGTTIGEGGNTTIPSPGRSPKQPLPGIGLQDPLHGRQAYPEFIAFDQGVDFRVIYEIEIDDWQAYGRPQVELGLPYNWKLDKILS